MTPFFVAIFFLGLSSVATAINFTQVYEWPDEWDYEWPSEANRTQARRDGSFKPEYLEARYMAVYGSRIFLNLYKDDGIPATLVSFPTSSASSAPPKLSPFPSWEIHLYGKENCNKIHQAEGLQVDSVGRLWVLDDGSSNFNCRAKLWIFNLDNNGTELIHRFSFTGKMHDLVIDETPNETFAYITRWDKKHIVVFSLEKNESWIVNTPAMLSSSIALSPKVEPRQLYLSKYHSKELYSISVAALRNGTRTENPEFIGNWTEISAYKMLMDNRGTMYAAFLWKNHVQSWNTSQPLQENRIYQVTGLEFIWPFNFALDQDGTLWMTVFDKNRKPKYRLLKAAVGAQSYIFEASPDCSGSCHKNGTA
ncbi:protein yellow-like [Cloeon dipterum]|uniref:protein yellow-like n=1 Tax=Cloeon dipterum TaxID=197152 RepID=UPI00321FA705